MHRLHPSDRDLVALGDKIVGQRLRLGHPFCPRVAAVQQIRHRAQGEVPRADGLELVPGDRKGDRGAGPDPRTVGRDHGCAAGPGRVDEDLAVPLLDHECGGGQHRVDLLGAGGDGPGGRGDIGQVGRGQRNKDVHALGATGLRRAGETSLIQHLLDQLHRAHGKGETLLSFDIGRRIEVEDQVGLVERVVLASSGPGGTRRRAGWRTRSECADHWPARTRHPAWAGRPRWRPTAPIRGCTSAGSSA